MPATDTTETAIVITKKEFWQRKVDWYIQMWKFGRHNDEAFTKNMQLMGYDEDTIKDCLEDYYEEE
tara:strand:+ start:41 stop:238 length:198 start_codon:yes stop_codon:yes gene_type:complete